MFHGKIIIQQNLCQITDFTHTYADLLREGHFQDAICQCVLKVPPYLKTMTCSMDTLL